MTAASAPRPAEKSTHGAHDSDNPTGVGLDFPATVERPSTLSNSAAGSREQRQWTARPRSPGPVSLRHTARAARDPGAEARDAPVRLLPSKFVPLQPEQRADAVRALTEMILSWMQRTGRAAAQDGEADDDLDQAA